MSSLQKFHRRTLVAGGGPKLIGSEAPVAGAGFYLGKAGDGTSYMYVAPKSTESSIKQWGSGSTVRNTTSTTNGVANTNTLYSFGSVAYPAAHYCRSLTTGGYSWYLPARDELMTCWSNHQATPFATANDFGGYIYWSSTEYNGSYVWTQWFDSGGNQGLNLKSRVSCYTRAVRRALV